MILQDTITESNINVETKKYNIKKSPVAYQILYDKLYDNPHRAVIRELITNAYDSQVKNGNANTPISITIPTYVDPKFHIRDYGTGLSKEEIFDLYTTFFESDKRETNEFTGCFGLGSKSPFAISDGFTVISYYEGIKYTYLNVKKDGYPCIFLTHEEPTDEPNGLSITIPVKEKDIPVIKNNLVYLKYLPEVKTNLEKDDFPFSTKSIEYDVFTFYEVENYRHNRQLFIKQGQTVISLEERSCFSAIVNQFQELGNNLNIVMEVPIGSIEISPSREHITESEHNVDFLTKYFYEHYTKLVDHFRKAKPMDYPKDYTFLFDFVYQKEFRNDSNPYIHTVQSKYTTTLSTYWYVYNTCKYCEYHPDDNKWYEGNTTLQLPVTEERKYSIVLCQDGKEQAKIKKIIRAKYPNEHWLIFKPNCKSVSRYAVGILKQIHEFLDAFHNDPRFPITFDVLTATKFLNIHKDYKIPRKKKDVVPKDVLEKTALVTYTPVRLKPRNPIHNASYRLSFAHIMQNTAQGKAIIVYKDECFNDVNFMYMPTLFYSMQFLKYKGRNVLFDFLMTKNPLINSSVVTIYFLAKSHKKYFENYPSFTLAELHDYVISLGAKFEHIKLDPKLLHRYATSISLLSIMRKKFQDVVFNSMWFKKGLIAYRLLKSKSSSLITDLKPHELDLLKTFFKDCPYQMFTDLTKQLDNLPTLNKAYHLSSSWCYNKKTGRSTPGISKNNTYPFLKDVLRRSYVFH